MATAEISSTVLRQDFGLPMRLQMLPAVPMTQDQFFDFCQQNRKLRIERSAQGEIIIMPPAGGESSAQNVTVSSQLYHWANANGSGRVFDSSVGFLLPNGATRSPDASWVSLDQLASLTQEQKKKFLPISPYFVVEVMSPSDSLRDTQKKLEEFLENGTKLGWLIEARKKQVHVYRPGQPVQIFDNPQALSADPELPGFTLDLTPVWNPF